LAADPEVPLFTEQLSLKQGLTVFGDVGSAKVINELKQLDYWDGIKPVLASSLTREQCQRALQYLMYLKRK